MRYRSLAAIALAATLLAGCHDGPTSLARGERTGTLHTLSSDVAAVIIEFEPAGAVTEIRIGPPDGEPGALRVSQLLSDRVLVYSDDALPAAARLRFVVRDGPPVTARIIAVATGAGELGGDVRLILD